MFYNPYAQPNQRFQSIEQQYPQFSQGYSQNFQQTYPQNPQTYPQASLGLQGKLVDSIDVVKAIDIPLDGSISYFPIADGSLIVTKQLQKDGTSRTVIYKPVEQEAEKKVDYITSAEFEKRIAENTENFAEELKNVKRQLRDINEEMRELRGRDDRDEQSY